MKPIFGPFRIYCSVTFSWQFSIFANFLFFIVIPITLNGDTFYTLDSTYSKNKFKIMQKRAAGV